MDVCFLGWDRLSQRKLDMHEGGWICAVGDGKVLCSVRRVDGVPRDKVQSTDEEASDLLPSKASLSGNLLPDAGKKMENEAAAPPQSNPHEHCCTERHLRIWSRVISRGRRWVSGSGEGRTQTNWVAARRTDWGEGATRHDQSGVVPLSCSPAPGTLVGLVA
ncbi:hypothetical protein B296_00024175 [Ensete ventricosum]|uniref:Uncharacterized protein n=1 Tax=Ensete ventricosum TaxID=4639 RepID=A0A426YGV7_ENSVE|nr:hypothetical protein B296_00024175 [Ensete ventricosum]